MKVKSDFYLGAAIGVLIGAAVMYYFRQRDYVKKTV